MMGDNINIFDVRVSNERVDCEYKDHKYWVSVKKFIANPKSEKYAVMVPGFSQDEFALDHFAFVLSAITGLNVIVVNNIGRGKSPDLGELADLYAYEGEHIDVNTLRTVFDQNNIRKALLFGNSWGGIISSGLAVEDNKRELKDRRVEVLILNEIGPFVRGKNTEFLARMVSKNIFVDGKGGVEGGIESRNKAAEALLKKYIPIGYPEEFIGLLVGNELKTDYFGVSKYRSKHNFDKHIARVLTRDWDPETTSVPDRANPFWDNLRHDLEMMVLVAPGPDSYLDEGIIKKIVADRNYWNQAMPSTDQYINRINSRHGWIETRIEYLPITDEVPVRSHPLSMANFDEVLAVLKFLEGNFYLDVDIKDQKAVKQKFDKAMKIYREISGVEPPEQLIEIARKKTFVGNLADPDNIRKKQEFSSDKQRAILELYGLEEDLQPYAQKIRTEEIKKQRPEIYGSPPLTKL